MAGAAFHRYHPIPSGPAGQIQHVFPGEFGQQIKHGTLFDLHQRIMGPGWITGCPAGIGVYAGQRTRGGTQDFRNAAENSNHSAQGLIGFSIGNGRDEHKVHPLEEGTVVRVIREFQAVRTTDIQDGAYTSPF